jgi:hypothetical protein
MMNIQQLDFMFPFIVFTYGLVLLAILNLPLFKKLAEEKLSPEFYANLQTKKLLAYLCFFVGGLWSLQNLWLS